QPLIEETHANLISSKLPIIDGDFHQMVQLMVHVISNAIKYNDRVPEIKVDATIVQRSDVAELPDYLTEPEYVQLRFADNGIGFEKQYAPQIYDIFRRLHSPQDRKSTRLNSSHVKISY